MRNRNYRKEYDRDQSSPKQIKERAERNAARREEIKKLGHSPKGDVGHKKPLISGGSNTHSNIHVEAIKKNRGWRKGESGYKVPTEK